MAKNDLKKIDNQLEEARKKVATLEQERKEVEENLQKQIGKIYVQIQLKKTFLLYILVYYDRSFHIHQYPAQPISVF